MKKYRLTKITVKTKETISLAKNSTDASPIFSVCRICHTAFQDLLAAETAAEIDGVKKRFA